MTSFAARNSSSCGHHVLATHLLDNLAGGVAGVNGRQDGRRLSRSRLNETVLARFGIKTHRGRITTGKRQLHSGGKQKARAKKISNTEQKQNRSKQKKRECVLPRPCSKLHSTLVFDWSQFKSIAHPVWMWWIGLNGNLVEAFDGAHRHSSWVSCKTVTHHKRAMQH